MLRHLRNDERREIKRFVTFVFMCGIFMCTHIHCMCVCVCVRGRERERQKERDRREIKPERMFMTASSCPGRNDEWPNFLRVSTTHLGVPACTCMTLLIILAYVITN